MRGDFIEGSQDRLINCQVVFNLVAFLVLLAGQRPIPGFYRVGAARDFNDRRVIEMLGEALQIDGR